MIAELLKDCVSRGAAFIPEGDSIRVKAEKPLPDELIERLRANKPVLRRLLDTLTHATNGLSVTPYELLAEMSSLDIEDWEQGHAHDAALRAYAEAVAQRMAMERGEIPAHYTATTNCDGCGTVPIFQGCPERVAGCPWCWIRRAQA